MVVKKPRGKTRREGTTKKFEELGIVKMRGPGCLKG
jgi:hypothetical protein